MRTIFASLIVFIALAVSMPAQDHSNHNHKKDQKETVDSTKMNHKDHMNHSDSTTMKHKDHADAKPWNTMCPVMQEEVDPEVKTVEYNGKNYGFCCKSCIKKFKNDPAKYAAKLSEDGTKIIKK